MKIKKTFGLLAAVAVVAAAGWSYQQSKQYDGLSELAMENVEALATGEDNPWYQWPTQGTTKDEWAETKPCEETINLVIYQVSWKGKRTICHDGGTENCTTVICDG